MPAKTKPVKRVRPGVQKAAQLAAAVLRFGHEVSDYVDPTSRRTQSILERLADARLALLDVKHRLERP